MGRLEETGLVDRLENEIIPADAALQRRLVDDHVKYIKQRLHLMENHSVSDSTLRNLTSRGVGGSQNFFHVRCLHMHWAFHLVNGPTAIGSLMEKAAPELLEAMDGVECFTSQEW